MLRTINVNSVKIYSRPRPGGIYEKTAVRPAVHTRHAPEGNVSPSSPSLRFALQLFAGARARCLPLLHPHIITEAPVPIHRERYAQRYEHVPFRSHVSRDPLISQALTRNAQKTHASPRPAHSSFNYRPPSSARDLCVSRILPRLSRIFCVLHLSQYSILHFSSANRSGGGGGVALFSELRRHNLKLIPNHPPLYSLFSIKAKLYNHQRNATLFSFLTAHLRAGIVNLNGRSSIKPFTL